MSTDDGYPQVFEQQYSPENIVFVIDLDRETNTPLSGAPGPSRLESLKESLKSFALIKSRLNPAHQYGIVALKDTCEWRCQLTSNATKFGEAVNALTASTEHYPAFRLSCICSLLQPQLLEEEQQRGVITRFVLIYSRSGVVPDCNIPSGMPVPRVDLLYLHDKPEPGLNCPQDVYNLLTQAIDGWHFETEFHSYIFEAHAVKKLRVNMHIICVCQAHLLSHPLQRVHQLQLPRPADLCKLQFTEG